MSDLEPITRAENFWVNEGDLEPITRKEQYIKHLYDETQVVPEYPKTREEYFINKAGEELHDVTIERLTVTENGTYSESGKAYSPVIVDVPLPENAYLLKSVANLPQPIATFTDGSPLPMPKLEVAIEPQQDLHGYDAPWVGGAGKNKFDIEGWLDSCGATYTKNGNSYTISATAALFNTPYQFSDTDVNVSVSVKSFIAGTATVIRAQLLDVNGNVVTNLGDSSSYQEKNSISASRVRFNWTTRGTFTITEPQIEFAPRATTFAPYSNICPISGWSAVDVTVADDVDNPTTTKTITIQLGDTYYGGKLDVVSGVMTVTHGYIASYNGETLPSTWISDRDVYAEGTTPTTGAQVVYELATPTTIQLTPTAVSSLLGQNNLWANTGDVVDGQYFSKEE